MDLRDDELGQIAEADRRKVDPPIQVETAIWSKAGSLDWLGEGTAGVVGSRTRCRRPSTMDQGC
jgi:hypothetical protein